MTSSPELDTDAVPMPRGLPAMWRLCKLGYQHEPWLLVAAFVLSLLAAVPDVLLALWLALLGAAVIHHHDGAAIVFALAMGVSATATWLLRTVSTRIQRRFRDKVTIALESHVAGLQASIATVAHQERPDYLDRLSVLRNQVFVLDHMYMSLFTTAGWILRLVLTVGARRPRVPFEGTEVRRPHQRRRLVGDQVGACLPGSGLRVVPPRHHSGA